MGSIDYLPPALQGDRRAIARRQFALKAFQAAGMERIHQNASRGPDALRIEQDLNARIVGQSQAISAIADAVELAEFKDPERPIASFIFLGPTGVGKTEAGRELARSLHNGDDSAFLKIDCTEYADDADLSVLIGAPPKYNGREQKPRLDPDIIEIENSVVLFDEVEKACEELHNLLMQILWNGEIMLHNGGRVVSFRKSYVILTSNVGSDEIVKASGGTGMGFRPAPNAGDKEATRKSMEDAAYKALKMTFSPEFIGRTNLVAFNTLDDEKLGDILKNHIVSLAQNPVFQERNIRLTPTREVIDEVVRRTPNRRDLGARPVLDFFSKTVYRDFVRNIINGSIANDSWVHAVLSEEQSTISEIPVDFYSVAVGDTMKTSDEYRTLVDQFYGFMEEGAVHTELELVEEEAEKGLVKQKT